MGAFGNLMGIRATLLLGQGPVLTPAGPEVMAALEEIEIRVSSTGPSGFKMTLLAGRDGLTGQLGPPHVEDPRLQRGARLAVTMWNGVVPTPVFDGIVTKTQYLPGSGASDGRYLLLGRDLTWLMDQEDKRVQHPAQDETVIVNKIVAGYAQYGIVPMVMPPVVIDPPIPVDRTPHQSGTDLAYLTALADRHGYRVCLDPGPAPGTSTLWFGPLPRPEPPQKALSVDMGPMSDAYDVTVEHNGERLTAARARVQDRNTGSVSELQMPTSTSVPNSAMPEAVTQMGKTRETRIATSGLNAAQVMGRLTAAVNASAEAVVTVQGEVDNARYNGVLKPYRMAQIRGLGLIYDGLYSVAEIRHTIRPGHYTQRFTLHGDGLYPIIPAVTPEVAPI